MLRKSLRISLVEGLFAELVSACSSGGVLTAWALYLELSPLLIGVLGALPLAAQFVHLPAAWISRRFGNRRTALLTIAISRQAVLPLAALPFLPLRPETREAIFLACAFGSALLSIVGNNAWTAWMGDLVPAPLRGSYFGRRTAWCALAATCSSLAAGLVLDGGRSRGHAGLALCILTLTASAAGAVTTLLLKRQHEPQRAGALAAPTLRDALAPVRDPRLRRLLAFQVAWSAAGGLAAAFYPLHMIANLRMGFARMAVYAAGMAAFRMLAAPIWGRFLDRAGASRVLVICAFALSVSPVLWIFTGEGHLWPLAIDAALVGAASAGLSLANFSLPIALSGPRERSFYIATLAASGGLVTGLASAGGGAMVKLLPALTVVASRPLVASQVLFLCGGAARFCAAFLALRIADQPLDRVVSLPEPPRRAKLAA